MDENRTPPRWRSKLVVACVLALTLSACGGGGDSVAPPPAGGIACGPRPAGPGTVDITPAGLAAATTLNVTIHAVCINSAPIVSFTVTNQNGVGMAGLTDADLRFNIAKLTPNINGAPGNWQNYINRGRNGAVQGSQERAASGYAFGTLVNRGDGTYLYQFATDITVPAANLCPAPCTDAAGKPLDLSYQPNFMHRVAIQQGNGAYPKATAVRDFVPSGSAANGREIVQTATCNTCHEQLAAHGTRVDVRLCVTCHNPGSWVAQTPNTTVDFKVMIHKIHYNVYNSVAAADPAYLPRTLPSVTAGSPYMIGSADFSTPVFTQDARNCVRCHDGALSAQGDNWKNQPSAEACSSCHDNVYFGAQPDPSRPYQTVAHSGGNVADNSSCALCHGPGRVADVTVAHNFPARLKAATARFKFNIISAAPSTPGGLPVVTFSVTDPTNGDAPYDIKAHPAFTSGGASTLNVRLGWTAASRVDIGNDGSGENFGQPVSIDALASAVAGATPGTYTVTSLVALPATGTLRVMIDGHPAGDVTTPGTFSDRLPVKSAFRDFAITGTAAARRVVVDIAKCNVCHDVVSLHGNNRTNELGVCAVCHNPNATDKGQRTTPPPFADGKVEEAIDFKTMIHAIHAGQASNGGFREKGIVIYGFGGRVNDFSKVVFPGRLSDCTTCHTDSSYRLSGIWAAPTANGILGNTISTGASATDASDNLRISPIAAVCSSCHDNAVAKGHMEINGANFSANQATLDGAVIEGCELCHGSGRTFDVKVLHGVK